MINALSIDLEFWWENECLTKYLPNEKPDQIIESVNPLLDLLDRYNTKATFFVVGTVMEKHPGLIREIYDKGHEIGSHGCSHKMVNKLTPAEFEEEIVSSVNGITSIIGERPIGFRAPYFSIDNSTKWAFEILEKHGFKYDSSIFPVKTPLYGIPNAPLGIYTPSIGDVSKEDVNGKIIEFPLAACQIGKRIPVSGGFYMRTMPFGLFKLLLKRVNKERPAILYLHPGETFKETPRLRIPISSKLITYYGINSMMNKVEGLLKNFKFAPARDILQL